MKRIRLILWILVGFAIAAFAILILRPQAPAAPGSTQTALTLGGPFTLTGSDGQPFSSTRLAGKPFALFFGFTNCPDVCPTALARLTRLRSRLEGGAEALNILFITVDPQRDGPAEVARYAASFGSPVIGLTGSPAQIGQVKKQLGIFSQRSGGGDAYGVDHTATVLLFDKQGGLAANISPNENDQAALAKLKSLTAS